MCLYVKSSHYDLPIALGVMAAIGAIPQDALDGYLALGELGLDGRLAHVGGVLPAAIAAQSRDLGLICAAPSGPEAAWAGEGLDIVAAESLLALANHLTGHQRAPRPLPARHVPGAALPDLNEVRGQQVARRALEVAAAGGHNLLMPWSTLCTGYSRIRLGLGAFLMCRSVARPTQTLSQERCVSRPGSLAAREFLREP